MKPQTSQIWKRFYPVAAVSEKADNDNNGGSGENGIVRKEEEEVQKEDDEVYCHCQRMPVYAHVAKQAQLNIQCEGSGRVTQWKRDSTAAISMMC